MPDWEDLGAFFDEGDFAVPADLYRDGVLLRTVSGIYDGPNLNAQIGAYDLDTIEPRLTCAWYQVQDIERGDVVRIDGVNFDVLTSAQPDGTGLGILSLAPPG